MYFCVDVFCLQVYLCTICVQYPKRPEEGARTLGMNLQIVVYIVILVGTVTQLSVV